MLDRFLEVAYEAEKQASNRQQLVDELKRLPVDELKKIASGESKIAYIGDDPCWLDKFKDSPFYQDALALEEQGLELEIVRQQKEMAERQNRDTTWEEQDALRVKKRMLELELRKAEAQAAGAPPEPEMAPPAVSPPPEAAPAPAPAADPAPKVAGAEVGMLGRAGELLSGSHARRLGNAATSVRQIMGDAAPAMVADAGRRAAVEGRKVLGARVAAGGVGLAGASMLAHKAKAAPAAQPMPGAPKLAAAGQLSDLDPRQYRGNADLMSAMEASGGVGGMLGLGIPMGMLGHDIGRGYGMPVLGTLGGAGLGAMVGGTAGRVMGRTMGAPLALAQHIKHRNDAEKEDALTEYEAKKSKTAAETKLPVSMRAGRAVGDSAVGDFVPAAVGVGTGVLGAGIGKQMGRAAGAVLGKSPDVGGLIGQVAGGGLGFLGGRGAVRAGQGFGSGAVDRYRDQAMFNAMRKQAGVMQDVAASLGKIPGKKIRVGQNDLVELGKRVADKAKPIEVGHRDLIALAKKHVAQSKVAHAIAHMNDAQSFVALPEHEKVAIVGALRAAIPGVKAFAGQAAQGLGTAMKSGNLGQMATSVKNIGTAGLHQGMGWAAKNPGAAAAVGAGALGTAALAGRATA